MATIATLTIDLVGKSAKLTAELKKANKNTKSWADKTRKMVSTSSQYFAGFGTAGVAALTAIYAKNAQFIDQQAKTADRLGVTTQALTGLQHAAEQTGASTETLNMGLQRMTRRIADQSAEAKKGLDILGLSFDDLKGKSADQQFALIADKMQDVADQGQKVAATQKLFDSEGVKLLNTLALGSDGIKAMMDEAQALGFAFDRVDAAKIEMANDAFDRAQKSTYSFGQALTTETAPIVAALSDMFTDAAKEAGGFGQVAQNVVIGVSKGVGFLADTLHGVNILFKTAELSAYGFSAALWKGLAFVVNEGIVPFANSVTNGLLFPIRKVLELSQHIPGIGDAARDALIELNQLGDGIGFEMLDSVGNQAFDNLVEKRKEFHDLIMEPIPSQKIEAWIGNVQTKFDKAAENIASNSKTNLSDFLNTDKTPEKPETPSGEDPLVTAAKNRYQQIYDTQLQHEGREVELENRRYQRKLAEMEAEFQLLRDKNLVTQEIETEYRLAREQLEAQHKETLSQNNNDFWDNYMESIRNTAQNSDQLWADTLTNFSRNISNHVTNAVFEWKGFGNLVENIAKSFAKTMVQSLIEIGTQRLTLWALETALGKASATGYVTQVAGQAQAGAHLSAINSFASTAAIPIVGPALAPGAAAAAEAFTQPLAAAAVASATSSLASFDGGGYTGDGPRIGGVDGKGGMFAIVHPQETVVDHTKGQKLGTNIVVNIHEDAAKAGQVSQRSLSEQDVIDVWVSNIQQGGEAATAAELTWDLKRQGY